MPTADPDLARIDAALVGLRRLGAHETSIEDPETGRVELSTVWVVDALLRSGWEHQSVADLAGALDVAHSTASRFVTRAERAGVVQRARLIGDSRQVAGDSHPAERRSPSVPCSSGSHSCNGP